MSGLLKTMDGKIGATTPGTNAAKTKPRSIPIQTMSNGQMVQFTLSLLLQAAQPSLGMSR